MIKKILLGLLALVLLTYLGYALFSSKLISRGDELCQGIEVELHVPEGRTPFMQENDVLKEIKRMGIRVNNVPLDSVDVPSIENKLRENPIFSTVEVYLSPSSQKLKIELEQKDPLFIVLPDGASPYYVTVDKGILQAQPSYAVYVPAVSGKLSEKYALTNVYDLMQYLKQDDYFRDYFGQCYVDSVQGITLIPRVLGPRVELGRSTQWRKMMDKFRRFDTEVRPKVGMNAFEYVKLQFEGQVVAKNKFVPEKQGVIE